LVNEEKVVKPPQTPTIRNRRRLGEIISLLDETPAKNPIIKLPNTFIVKVPKGME